MLGRREGDSVLGISINLTWREEYWTETKAVIAKDKVALILAKMGDVWLFCVWGWGVV